ncbi:MAG: 4Fe-4S binding protein [Victivallaceae bacterium]|nr:4Fe-4S binding protein [Victivallaceae bacterium]
MLDLIKIRIEQGKQYIPDLRKAEIRKRFRGFPVLNGDSCGNCQTCISVCPASAISLQPLSLDMGKCVFCDDCVRSCPANAISFSNFHKTSSTSREFLKIGSGLTEADYFKSAIRARKEIVKIFGRSLKLRNVSAGGCNGCEMELNACSNVNFDMGRFGIETVASPRHADGLIITGPVTENMAGALEDTFKAIPEPRIVIAVGACAISGGAFQDSPALERSFFNRYKVDLYVPGCPAHPLTIINGILDFLRR